MQSLHVQNTTAVALKKEGPSVAELRETLVHSVDLLVARRRIFPEENN
jgi:hypothetical protein